MAEALQVAGNTPAGNFFGGPATFYTPCGNTQLISFNAETSTQVIYRTAGTLSKLFVLVANTGESVQAATVKIRKNGADGNMSVSIPADTSGIFEDNSNTDTVAAGDTLNYAVVLTGANIVPIRAINTLFAADTNTVVRHVAVGTQTVFFQLTLYAALAGPMDVLSSEPTFKFDVNTAGSLKNLYVYVLTNSRTDATTFKTRINGVTSTNLVISVPASSSGAFEDTSGSDTLAADDDVNYIIATGPAFGPQITWTIISTELETTNSKFHAIASKGNAGRTQNASLTKYYPLGGLIDFSGVEADFQIEANIAATITNLFVYCSAGTGTITLRKNGAATALTKAITGAGAFEDSTNSVSVVAGDLIDYEIVTTGAGSITTRVMGCMLENTAAPPAAATSFVIPRRINTLLRL